jgi:hypothetical protein
MGHSLTRVRSATASLCAIRYFLALLAVGPSFAFAGGATVLEPILNTTAAREFPQAIFDRITAKITYQTTFQHVSPGGIVRWSPRTIKLIEFVKAASPTYPDTELYAMRYAVRVLSDKQTLAVHETICQVVVVHQSDAYSEPNVACAPVNLDLESDTS